MRDCDQRLQLDMYTQLQITNQKHSNVFAILQNNNFLTVFSRYENMLNITMLLKTLFKKFGINGFTYPTHMFQVAHMRRPSFR